MINSLRRWLRRTLCLWGLHRWSNWGKTGYSLGGMPITQYRKCLVCDYTQKEWL